MWFVLAVRGPVAIVLSRSLFCGLGRRAVLCVEGSDKCVTTGAPFGDALHDLDHRQIQSMHTAGSDDIKSPCHWRRDRWDKDGATIVRVLLDKESRHQRVLDLDQGGLKV